MFYQQPEPPNKGNTFMEKFGLSALLVVFTTIATIVGTVLLGKIQVLDFSWLLFGLVLILIVITSSFAWYNIKTRSMLQKKYQEDRKALLEDYLKFKDNWQKYFDAEKMRWDEWAIGFSQSTTKRLEEGVRETGHDCREAIADAESRMDNSIKTAQTIFSGAVDSYKYALDSQTLYILDVMEKKLQEMLTTKQIPDEQENISPPSQETYDGV